MTSTTHLRLRRLADAEREAMRLRLAETLAAGDPAALSAYLRMTYVDLVLAKHAAEP